MRAAIYFAPAADHALSVAAAAWLGRNAWTGGRLDRPPVAELEAETLDVLLAEPRRYGFHATLKPPFRPADGWSLDDLRLSLAAFGRKTPPVGIGALRLERIGSFFALTPDGDAAAVHALGDDVVRAFEPFRAPLTPEEIVRRRPERLTQRQREHLAAWGYPYVFDEFRFHMTLTGPVPEDHCSRSEAILRERFAGFIGRPLAVDSLCLFVESGPQRDFVVDTAILLTGRRG